jgi:uncharacterized membrane protein YcaP (DUF421 family)
MELWRIIVRALFAYIFALAVVRIAGKRTISYSDVSSFAVVIVIGDMFDDMLWADVPAAQFVVGVGTLVLAHISVGLGLFKRAARGGQEEGGART